MVSSAQACRMELVLKCAFDFRTVFPTTGALNEPIRWCPNLWKWWIYYKPTLLYFQVSVLGCCNINLPCFFLVVYPPSDGSCVCVFFGVAHPPHSSHSWSGNTGGHNSMDIGSCYSSCSLCVVGRGSMLLSSLSFHRTGLCLHYHVCEALTVLAQDRQFTSILSWVTKVLWGLWHYTWLNRVCIVMVVVLHSRKTHSLAVSVQNLVILSTLCHFKSSYTLTWFCTFSVQICTVNHLVRGSHYKHKMLSITFLSRTC